MIPQTEDVLQALFHLMFMVILLEKHYYYHQSLGGKQNLINVKKHALVKLYRY